MPTTTEKGGAPAQRTRPSARQAKENLADLSIREQLIYIQQMLAAPKDNENTEKHFRYRTLDGIIAAVKPLLFDCSCTLTFSEDILSIEQGAYIISTATLTNLRGESIETKAFAREDTRLPGMCSAQISGACISYARKYAACGLFAIDNTRLVEPIELDSFSPSAVEELKRAEEHGEAPLPDSPERPVNAALKPVLSAGQGDWQREVERVKAWEGSEESFVDDLRRRWSISDNDILVLLSRRDAPFAG